MMNNTVTAGNFACSCFVEMLWKSCGMNWNSCGCAVDFPVFTDL